MSFASSTITAMFRVFYDSPDRSVSMELVVKGQPSIREVLSAIPAVVNAPLVRIASISQDASRFPPQGR